MTDPKFTDAEVIQALKCCADKTSDNCADCPCKAKGMEWGDECIPAMCKAALDLINKQTEPISCGREKGGWISVDERLPEESCECLAASRNGVIYLLQYSYRYKAFNATDDDGGDKWKLGDFTHWMPLPEPPVMKGGAE
jgi:hypothetical protein